MYTILASDPLATLGQVSAIILLLFMLVNILIGLALAFALMFGLSWVREKVELIKKLRPAVDSVNVAAEAAIQGTQPALIGTASTSEKVAYAAAQVPRYSHTIEQKVEQGSDRVAGTVIEFRARTVMVTGTIKAFFLPGLTKRRPAQLPVGQDTIKELQDGRREVMAPISETHAIEGATASDTGGEAEAVASGQAPRP